SIENAEEKIDANLRYFLGITDYLGNERSEYGDMGNRTPTSEAEQHAARKLFHHYTGEEENPDYDSDSASGGAQWLSGKRYEHVEVTDIDKTGFDVSMNDETRRSFNVEIRYTGTTEHEKQVIIGTGYDTAYGKVAEAYQGQQSTGALENGTGVAALMTLIDWCEETQPALDFDLVFVFFGCSAYNGAGAAAYVEAMAPTQKLNTLLMVNLHRFGGDRTYLYADEVKTEHETFLRKVADENGLSVYTLPSNIPLIDGVYRKDIYYAHYGMLGGHAAFLDAHIPSAYLFDGYYGSFNLSELEKKGASNLGSTKEDTYPSLVKSRPAYKTHAADALTLLISAIRKDGFVSAMATARKNEKDISFWVNPFWANMIVIFAVVALIVVLVVLVKYFEKKHPYVPTVRKLKVAVFGMDYEDKQSADIFIDVKSRSDPFGGGDNPFDGY
ncbi:MAG: M28 family peptidase, partial [Clostridiales bacterium]|nr:M28 family peptidase [Clostridiales bacterium]